MTKIEFNTEVMKFQQRIVDLAEDMNIKIIGIIEVLPELKEDYLKIGSITLHIKPHQ